MKPLPEAATRTSNHGVFGLVACRKVERPRHQSARLRTVRRTRGRRDKDNGSAKANCMGPSSLAPQRCRRRGAFGLTGGGDLLLGSSTVTDNPAGLRSRFPSWPSGTIGPGSCRSPLGHGTRVSIRLVRNSSIGRLGLAIYTVQSFLIPARRSRTVPRFSFAVLPPIARC